MAYVHAEYPPDEQEEVEVKENGSGSPERSASAGLEDQPPPGYAHILVLALSSCHVKRT